MITKRAFDSANWRKALCQLLVVALVLPLAAVTLTPQTAQAGRDNPRAHSGLLKHVQEHPNDTIGVIVQSDTAQMGQPGDDPEQAVKTKGGNVNKKLGLINGFAAELSGKEIGKLAKHNRETQKDVLRHWAA